MPKEDFDLDALIGEMELADDAEKETARKILSREKNQGFVLRQSQFDKKMNAAKADLETKVTALAEKQETLDQILTQNFEYKGKTDKSVEEYKAKTEKEVATLRAKAVKAAELAGYTLDEIEADEVLTPKVKAKPEVDLSELDKKYVTPDALNRLATGHINLTLDLGDIQDVHEDLLGKKMTRKQKEELLAEFGKDLTKNPQGTLMQTADRLYEFSSKRDELDKGKLKKLIEDAEARGRAKAIQEAGENGLPVPRRTGAGSVLFAEKTRKPGDAIDPNRGIKLAMEAINKPANA